MSFRFWHRSLGRPTAASLLVFGLLSLGAAQIVGPWTVNNKRDYTGNKVATDRFWFYKNLDGSPQQGDPPPGNGVYNSLEIDLSRGFQIPCAVYYRSASITVALTFTNCANIQLVGTVYFEDAKITVNSGDTPYDVQLNVLPSSQAVTIPAGGSATFNVTFFPQADLNYLCFGDLKIKGVLYGNTGIMLEGEPMPMSWGFHHWQNWEKVYFVDGSMGLQQFPWTDLLDLSCKWAHGEVGFDGVSRALTRGMHYGARWRYDPSQNHYWQHGGDPEEPGDRIYALSQALGAPPGAYMDCRDVSGLLALAHMSQGYGVATKWLETGVPQDPNGEGRPYKGFYTTPLRKMGYSQYDNLGFYFHHIVYGYHGACDASCAYFYDRSGNPYMEPVWDWEFPSYWQSAYGGPYYGLVFGWDPTNEAPVPGIWSLNNLTKIR